MEELKLLKELGLNEQLHIAGYVLLFSFIVKTLYKSHIQKLLVDIKILLSQTTTKISETFSPSLYQLLPNFWKKIIDFMEAMWSYLITIISLAYFVIFVLLFRYIEWSSFNLEKGVLYFGTLIIFLTLSLASIANGNKAVQRFRGA